MNGDVVVKIALSLVSIASAVVTYFLIPWLKTKVDENKMEKFRLFVTDAVRAMEQIYTPDQWLAKKTQVVKASQEYLNQLDLSLSEDQIEIIVEGIVNVVKHPAA